MRLEACLLFLAIGAFSLQAIADANIIRVKASISLSALPVEDPSTEEPVEEPTPPEPIARHSCLEIMQSGDGTSSGVYQITLGEVQQSVYCDMTSAGGGWTMVVAQFESDPVTNWNEGIQSDYDPSLASRKGFALNSSQIPLHTQSAFGQDLNPTAMDYGNFSYTTGDIPVTRMHSLQNSNIYQIHRSQTDFYDGHTVGNTLFTHRDPNWIGTLTVDDTLVTKRWAFSPNASTLAYRGYALNGARSGVADAIAWTIWVR